MSHPSYDEYWKKLNPIESNYGEVNVPTYGMGGWYDVFLQGTLNNYMGVKKASAYNKLSSSTKIGGLLLFAVVGLLINGNDFSRSKSEYALAKSCKLSISACVPNVYDFP